MAECQSEEKSAAASTGRKIKNILSARPFRSILLVFGSNFSMTVYCLFLFVTRACLARDGLVVGS